MEFEPQPKKLLFAGLGEPLMNPKLPNIIKEFREKGFVDQIEIMTNGSLLTSEMSDKLISAGVSKVRISLQGLSDVDYQENVGDVNFRKIVDNIQYYNKTKGKDAEIYVKIMNTMIRNKKEEKQGEINHLNVYGEDFDYNRKICAMVNYKLQINMDGEVLPCDISGLSPEVSFGNIQQERIVDIWNGERRRKIVCMHRMKRRNEIPVRKSCTAYQCVQVPEENIDDCALELLEKYKKKELKLN